MHFRTGIALVGLLAALTGCAGAPTAISASTHPAADASTIEPRFATSEFSLWDSPAFHQIAEDASKVAHVSQWRISFSRCESLETGRGPVFLDARDATKGWFVGAFTCPVEGDDKKSGFAGLRSSDWGARQHFDYVLSLKAQADAPSFDGYVLPATKDYATFDIGFSRPGRYTVTLQPGFSDPYAITVKYHMTVYVGASESWPVSVIRYEYGQNTRKSEALPDSRVTALPVMAHF